MTEILICNRAFNTQQLYQECGVSHDQLYCGGRSILSLPPYQPYLIDSSPSPIAKSIHTTLMSGIGGPSLFELAHTFGEDVTGAVADTMAKLDIEIAGVGASISTYSGRMEQFSAAVKKYQIALLKYRDTMKSSEASSLARRMAKQTAREAFDNMQKGFQKELSVVTSGVRSGRGTPLTNFTRGTDIARSSRSSAKLNVTTVAQAHNLVKLSRYSKKLGAGLVALDFTTRAANVHKSYVADGEWERDLFIESLSFTASAAVGTGAVKAGLYFLAVFTPAGWLGLIVAGTVIVGTAAFASTEMNKLTKDRSGRIYDKIMNWLNIS